MMHLSYPCVGCSICFSFFCGCPLILIIFSQCFSPQLLVEPGTKRFKSFNCKHAHSGLDHPTITTNRRSHNHVLEVRKSPPYRWMSPSLTNAVAHRGPKAIVGECPSPERQCAASRYWQAVHCLHFSSCFQLTGSWIRFTVLRCYRVLASHQPTITPPLSTTSVAKLSQWN